LEQYPDYRFTGSVTAINSKVDLNTHNILVHASLPNCPVEALTNPAKSSLVSAHKESRNNKTIISCSNDLNVTNKIRNFAFIPGMFASIELEQPAEKDTIVVPSTAVSYSLYGNAVYIIEKNKDGKKNPDGSDRLTASRVFVVTGEQQGNYTVIKKGIKEGQLVVSSGDIKLENDTPVTINNSVPLDTVTNPDTLGQ
jgi:membrane fusion protein (multidrug efflux system)